MRQLEELKKNEWINIEFSDKRGGSGYLNIPYVKMKNVSVIWTIDEDDQGVVWEHVSVNPSNRTPSWDEMCKVKEIFFEDEEEVIQIHPKKSEYVNVLKNCLHLWRPADGCILKLPPSGQKAVMFKEE